MISFLRNLGKKIATDPHYASRIVIIGVVIIGLLAFTLDFGPRIVPQYFQSRLLQPLVVEDVETLAKQLTTNEFAEEVSECYNNRIGDGNAELFLRNFEKSFAGILPGAGNLLIESPAIVVDRKKKLIFEVMKKYAKLKFCIEPEPFKPIYFSKYTNLISELEVFMQARTMEIESTPRFTEKQNILISTFTEEYGLVERDLIYTQKHVVEIIDYAIESAIELDRQTNLRLNNLSQKTQSQTLYETYKLLMQNNYLTSVLTHMDAERNTVLSSSYIGSPVIIAERIEPIDNEKKEIFKENDELKNNVSTDTNNFTPVLSYGVLNLVPAPDNNRLKKEFALYVLAREGLDILQPVQTIDGSELKALTSNAYQPSSDIAQKCNSIDSGSECFKY